MFFVSKKKYEIAQEQAEVWRKIAAGRDERIEELLKQIRDLYDKYANMYNYGCELKHDNEELLTRVKELEAENEGLELRIAILNTDYDALDYEHVRVCKRLDAVCEERDRYKERVEAFEEGKYLVREAE